MTLKFHPAVQRDFNDAIAYYEAEGGLHLADRFETDFRASLAAITVAPTRFSYYWKSDRLRRVRLKSFPFLVVYRVGVSTVRILVLKHERRHPQFGLSRE